MNTREFPSRDFEQDRAVTDSLGRTKITPSVAKRLRSRLLVVGDCWEWQGFRNRKGYGHIGWDRALYLTHRVAYEMANGPIPESLLICHTCDNPPCCNPEHLFVGTHLDNARDMTRKGRGVTLRGLASGRGKFSDEQIEIARRRVASGETQKSVALDMGIDASYVCRLVNLQRRAA